MLVTLSGILTLSKLVQESNALTPMLVILSGMKILVKTASVKNALSPMLVTGRPLMVSGIVTTPLEPVYLVMVMAPLLVVKVNCACTTAGSSKSSRSGSSFTGLFHPLPPTVARTDFHFLPPPPVLKSRKPVFKSRSDPSSAPSPPSKVRAVVSAKPGSANRSSGRCLSRFSGRR